MTIAAPATIRIRTTRSAATSFISISFGERRAHEAQGNRSVPPNVAGARSAGARESITAPGRSAILIANAMRAPIPDVGAGVVGAVGPVGRIVLPVRLRHAGELHRDVALVDRH